jgi:hypothetical protein
MATKKKRRAKRALRPERRLDPIARLKEIRAIMDRVENRCMAADGAVTDFREEVALFELKEIYRLASDPYNAEVDNFTRGYAVALAQMVRYQANAKDLLREANIGLAELKQAKVMEFDMAVLRPLLRRK